MNKLTDKDKYTYITIKWSTYERIISETDGGEYDGDENDTYEAYMKQDDLYYVKSTWWDYIRTNKVRKTIKFI